MSNFDLGYRDPMWSRLEDKDAEIERLKQTIDALELDLANALGDSIDKDAEIDRLHEALSNIIALTKNQTGAPMNNIYFEAKAAINGAE